MSKFTRRSMLRGVLGGTAVCVGIPALDIFLDNHGKAYADGAKLPLRFGTYFWGLGLTPIVTGGSRWVPKEASGTPWTLTPQLKSLAGLEKKITVFSGFKAELEGKSNIPHFSGTAALLTGRAPNQANVWDGATFDTAISDAIGSGTRFRQIDTSPYGSTKSYSTRTPGAATSPADASPLQLYTRLFGEGFQDPNADNFTPDPQVMLRKSVLSAVGEQRQALMSSVGASDKASLDQYFTSVRAMENRLAIELEKPAKAESCLVPKKPPTEPLSRDIYTVNKNNKLMAELLAMGLACNQTKVFTVLHSDGTNGVFLPDDPAIYHLHTHDEPVDPTLGYQVLSEKCAGLCADSFGDFVHALDAIKEGDGTLLDNTLVFGYSDSGYARVHSVENIPVIMAGGARGAHKAGKHIQGNGDPVSRLVLTAQQLAGLQAGTFGEGAMRTTKAISEVIA
jgi:hypothetical protein